MQPLNFPDNDDGMMFQYHRMREGPNYFMCHYKHSSVLRQDPKDAWRVLGSAKFTNTGKALKEWCLEMHQKWVIDRENKDNKMDDGRKDTSFASEAQIEDDPTANTKMVT